MGKIYSKAKAVMMDLSENLPERDAIAKGIELEHILARIPPEMI